MLSNRYTSNVDVFILSQVNILMARYGLSPSDTEAYVVYDDEKEKTILKFVSSPVALEKIGPFDDFMDALGCQKGELVVESSHEIEKALHAALAKAPRARGR